MTEASRTHSQYTVDYQVGYEYRSETLVLLNGTNVEALVLAENPECHKIHKIHWDGCARLEDEPRAEGPVMHPPTWPVERAYARRYDAWAARRRAQGLPLR